MDRLIVQQWRKFYRDCARLHVTRIRQRRLLGMPWDKAVLDLRHCLARRNTGGEIGVTLLDKALAAGPRP